MITCHLRYQKVVYRLAYQKKPHQFTNGLVNVPALRQCPYFALKVKFDIV